MSLVSWTCVCTGRFPLCLTRHKAQFSVKHRLCSRYTRSLIPGFYGVQRMEISVSFVRMFQQNDGSFPSALCTQCLGWGMTWPYQALQSQVKPYKCDKYEKLTKYSTAPLLSAAHFYIQFKRDVLVLSNLVCFISCSRFIGSAKVYLKDLASGQVKSLPSKNLALVNESGQNIGVSALTSQFYSYFDAIVMKMCNKNECFFYLYSVASNAKIQNI